MHLYTLILSYFLIEGSPPPIPLSSPLRVSASCAVFTAQSTYIYPLTWQSVKQSGRSTRPAPVSSFLSCVIRHCCSASMTSSISADAHRKKYG